jgi:predicted porin
MKNVSKLALFVAAGMVSAGANAASFEVDESTTLTLGGKVVVIANDDETGAGVSESEFTDDGSLVAIGGERDLGNGMTAYVEAEFDYNTLGEDGALGRDASVFGFTGDFGEIQVGASDNVFEDMIHDATDRFEGGNIDEVGITDESNMLTYYSPDVNGFSFRLQTRVSDETNNDGGSSELSLIAAAEYEVGNFALRAAYDDRGSVDAVPGNNNLFTAEDPVFGLATIIDVSDVLELSAKYSQEQNNSGNDRDIFGFSAGYDYGAGEIYGGVASVSPDTGEDRTEFSVGINRDLADDFFIYAEYASYDRASDSTDTDSLMQVGLELEY